MEPSECCSSGLLDLECAYCRAVHVSASLEGVEDLCCGGRMLHCFRCGTPVDVLRKRVTFPSGEGPVTGAVRLFREWAHDPERSPRLEALVFHYEYVPGVNTTRNYDNVFPELGFGPGFYGYYALSPELYDLLSCVWTPRGSVLGFGKVKLHERGAVCEKVVVESLILPSERALEYADGAGVVWGVEISSGFVLRRYRQLADYYGCHLISYETALALPTGWIEDQPVPGV